MRDLNYQLKQLCRHCREGSHATQAKRERMLTLIANQLHELDYRGMPGRGRTGGQGTDPGATQTGSRSPPHYQPGAGA